tara:strand:+ start:987 stop:1949 length:963 start_codon:yes stop_codon:yes gene_type:complete
MKDKIIIGIDGGATSTTAVMFNNAGETLSYDTCGGTNLSIDEEASSKKVLSLINNLCRKSNVDLESISALGIGLAGASNKNGRDRLFGLLDNINLSDKSLITNDIDPVYEFIWENNAGILLNVGTGVICVAKKNGNLVRIAGKGHDKGDEGSGYWIGKECLIQLGLGENNSNGGNQLLRMILEKNNFNSFDELINSINESQDKIFRIAKLAKHVIECAEKNNEFCIGIIQHATRLVADYVINLCHEVQIYERNIIIAGNGSVLKNNYFRKELNNALIFDFKELKWIFLDISAAYTSGILSARLKGIDINRKSLFLNSIKD